MLYDKLNVVVSRYLQVPFSYLGAVPQDSELSKAVMRQMPVSMQAPSSRAAQAYEELAAKLLNKEFSGDIMEFFRAAHNRRFFCSIDGIGEVLEDNIWKWANDYLGWIPFEDETINREKIHGVNWEIAELLRQLKFDQENEETGNSLSGMTFVITGVLKHYDNRDALVSVIEQNGGKVSGSVSAKTTYLINNDITSTSGKNKKAKELGIKIISEEDFINLLG